MSSQEPVYILKNGQPVPYIPATITTSRDAYAASLHVLFKHVADFHICIVRAFSSKYGIPEDDILKTIQESDEFKNMQVDPVLDTDSFGYLAEAPVVEAQKTKLIAKKTKTKKSVPAVEVPAEVPAVEAPVVEAPVVEAPVVVEVPAVEVPATKAPIQKKTPIASKAKKTKNEDQSEPIAPEVPATSIIADESREPESVVSKIKSIRKKIVPKPHAIVIETIESSNGGATAKVASSALTLTHEGDVPRKIIKKKTNAISSV